MSYTEVFKGKLRCNLCPHRCIITEGKSGVCMVRRNRGGKLSLPYYGLLSAVSPDPIEKKPLYHFYPGSSIFSVGFYGCSFKCPFCQNYSIAHSVPSGDGKRTEPEELVAAAKKNGAVSIAYTYSEPLVHFEWVLETAKIARREGLSNVLVSNGYLNRKPAEELLPWIDAANIDLKSFTNDYYTRVIGGKLQPVLDFISLAASRAHIEVTTLVIPGETDSDAEIDSIAGFISDINPDIPYHLSCYYPAYEYTIPPTEPGTVFHLVDTAKKRLNHVYPGNVGLSEVTTTCAECGNVLVRRLAYRVTLPGIVRGKGNEVGPHGKAQKKKSETAEPASAHCSSCGARVPFPV